MRFRHLAAIAAVCFSATTAPAGAAEDINTKILAGLAEVIDGDTIQIRGIEVRLHGIDAPEADQTCLQRGVDRWTPCGKISRAALTEFLRGIPVKCERRDVAKQRMIAECYARGWSINALQVRNGQAVASKVSNLYVKEQDAAQAAGLGIWRTEFVDPVLWRGGKRLPGEPLMLVEARR